jgi:hypothetical protein
LNRTLAVLPLLSFVLWLDLHWCCCSFSFLIWPICYYYSG